METEFTAVKRMLLILPTSGVKPTLWLQHRTAIFAISELMLNLKNKKLASNYKAVYYGRTDSAIPSNKDGPFNDSF